MKELEDKTVDDMATPEGTIKVKRPRKKREPGAPKKAKEPKAPKAPKVEKTLYEIFQERLAKIRLDDIKKPWMATKSFRLINRAAELQAWVATVLGDPSQHRVIVKGTPAKPVIAVDTETDGLDTRVVENICKTKLAGVCLSANGVEGIYIPVGHEAEGDVNIPARELAPILQVLFDMSHLVFFNAKYDREILRLKLGLTFKDYPDYEDVQVLNYLYDPKAQVDPGAGGFQSGGLKALSKAALGIEQIELDTLTKVRARVFNTELQKYTMRMVYCSFCWVPTEIALWYAAGDAITTWLLWDWLHGVQDFAEMFGVHRLDHQLIDTLTWIERQRCRLDSDRLAGTIEFHAGRVKELTAELAKICGMENFNPGSTPQLRKILFEDRNMEVIDVSEKSGEASTAIGVLKELHKRYPEDEFLTKLMDFREYAALHPGSIQYDPRDHSCRFYFKQNVVAGGRLAAAGGEFDKDGGCGINPQAIKKVGGNWWVKGKPIDLIPDAEPVCDAYEVTDLDPSCMKDGKPAPNIEANHIGTYFGKKYCMVPKCQCHTNKAKKVDANEVINLRGMFTADPGWTMFSIDYSNIEMRVAANVSKEPLFIKEFLEGSGDFHTLTALALFPEYSDPAVPAGRKKELRGVAKIINFALLYGGTAYTIHENLNKAGFPMTFEEAQELVDKYWESVPIFAAWCQGKRQTARSKLLCKTPTGRVIHFESAMKGYGIVEPLPEHKEQFWAYRSLKKQEVEYLKLGMKEEAKAVKAQTDEMWRNPHTGVKNMSEYNRFLGKAERVAINIPLQGTAGDLMRSALNRIRIWVMANPGMEKIFRLHLTVHDEIVFSVKNEFVPYVLPRINRLMKLRSLHTAKGWTVPIETDCEYGQTWDVQHHLTGDDGHKAAAWTEIEGLDTYVPPDFDEGIVDHITAAWLKGDQERVKTWLLQLHPRVHGYMKAITDETVRHIVTVMLQLHEFWKIDEDEVETQTVVQYAEDNGLTLSDEPLIGGLDGYLASIPLTDEVVVTPLTVHHVTLPPDPAPLPVEVVDESPFYEVTLKTQPPTPEVVSEPEPTPEPAPEPPADCPVKLPVLRTLDVDETPLFLIALGMGQGDHTVEFVYAYDDQPRCFEHVRLTTIPKEYQA